MNNDYDAIIVGARVAGSLLAAFLGQAGRRVLVLDRAKFPSDTLSTHFFRAPAFRAFAQAGVLDEVLAVAPKLTVNYNVIDGIVFPEPVDRPDDYPFYLCVRRITLDDILTRRAKSTPGVEMREGAKVNALLNSNGHVRGVRWQEAGSEMEATARVVVGADGLQSFVAKQVNPQAEKHEPVNRAMYYAYYRGVPSMDGPAAEFHYRGNNLVYCFPTDGGLALLAASVPIAQFGEFKRHPEGNLDAELWAMTALTERISKAEREGPVKGAANIPGTLRVPYGEGWALVGDAGMVIDPWSGQGIDQASTHAVYLARELNDYLSEKKNWAAAMAAYHKDRNEFSMKTFDRTCKFSRDLRPMTKAALESRGLA
ncbi:MAG: NAD(P)/FAD-dependent oxidoreductase [Anaerolineales bacterium]